ncbi:MAG: ATP-binding protein [Desulfuromonadales bacterium]|nr:ATP-binding protein [Desulfuromonadales bacterium]
MNEACAPPRPDFPPCSQLMAAQGILYALPGERRLAEFVVRALVDLPEVTRCSLCLKSLGSVVGAATAAAELALASLHVPAEAIDPSRLQEALHDEAALSLPLRTASDLYGHAILCLHHDADRNSLLPVVINFLNGVALEIESRQQRALLERSRQKLEEEVAARTEDLRREVEENRRLAKNLARELEINQSVADIANRLILPDLDIRATASLILDAARKLTGSEHGFVSEIDRASGDNICHALTPAGDDLAATAMPAQGVRFAADAQGRFPGLWGHSLNSRTTYYTNTASSDPHATGLPDNHVPLETFLSVPVQFAGKLVGQIALANARDAYDQRAGDTIARLASLYAMVIERRRADEDRRLFEERTRHASQMRSLGEVAAGVAHEINNPVTGVINYAQLLLNRLDRGDTSRLREFLEKIIKESQRIADIVRSLLGTAQQSSDRAELLSVEAVLREAIQLFQKTLSKNGVHLDIQREDGLPAITGHENKLCQVFHNLFSNALHALNQRYPDADPNKRLTIRLSQQAHGDQAAIVIVVRDEGPGIPADLKPKIFMPFFTTKPARQGTGLGLSIVHEIIALHRGEIEVLSEPGEFTEFRIKLPAERL